MQSSSNQQERIRSRVFLTTRRLYDVRTGLMKRNRTYRPFLTSDILLLLFIVATTITEAVGQKSLCADSISTLKEITVPIDGKVITSTFDDKKKDVNEEWVFRRSDNESFINVEFLKYKLMGPACNSSSQTGISKLEIQTDIDKNWYCKGRRKPDNMTGQDFMQISYCQKFQGGEIVFRVKSSCNGEFLVKKTAARIQAPYNREASCVIQLISTDKRMMIQAKLEEVSIGTVKSNSCKAGYLFVKDEKGRYLLPGGAKRLCNHKTYSNYRDGMSFSVISSVGSDRIIIKHRKAKFSLSFQLIDKVLEQSTFSAKTTARPYFSNATTNATIGGKLEDSAVRNTATKGYGHIIGIGCGGIFVLICIILVLLFVRRKKKRRRQSGKSSNSKKDTNGNAVENDSPAAVSSRSISNAIYGQILDGQGDNTSMNGTSSRRADGDADDLGRRVTRPQLPPPSACSTQDDKQKPRVSNIYEKIEDMQTFRGVESRPMSCATFTSDEFSDDDGLANDSCNYSVIMNNSSSHTTKRNGDGENAPHGSAHYDKMTPKIRVHPTLTYDTDTYINSDNDLRLLKSHRENEHEEGSASLLGEEFVTPIYASPRPSLPNLPRIALAEDAENYLSPRPSCPDVMVNNGYSSTDDISEIRKRILAAAHPSLLGTSKVSSTSVPETSRYHSPKVANAVTPSVYYSTPRRKENHCT